MSPPQPTVPEVTAEILQELDAILSDASAPMAKRMRAVFTLKNLKHPACVDILAKAFNDPSALLRHEVAYVLGQMQLTSAIPKLNQVLENEKEDGMVRHEAAEALGAIGEEQSIEILEKYMKDPVVEVAETCQIAHGKIKEKLSREANSGMVDESVYASVDPSPADMTRTTEELRERLLNTDLSLFERYTGLFGLRNRGDTDSVKAICDGFSDKSALFRHEIAYVLGQMQHPAAVDSLVEVLSRDNEHAMVRHEAAEALGAIGTPESVTVLEKYQKDNADVVRESCEVALDIHDYNADHKCFQYADGITQK
eukprot:TRINITY_DN3152_c0_g1_i1.p1 TRINITY_DN3152_c0_g1~~TRINITY_DN3152_c0_g1_i1.p1  ORF type:complete len:311 (+),score=76.29 TRINITY_DN3152_c0_g1_i1:173-1105(+)